MLGTDFARTLRAAQAGEEDAFVRLWRDANPAMIRYLRVVGHDDPYDEACEGWVTVVRGLPGFSGDEFAWRVWLLACARQRAEESTLRRAWGSVTVLPGMHVDGDGEIDIDELLEPAEAVDPAHRGITDTLTALRSLPLGQGEVVVLRLGAQLPPGSVADVVGVDEANIARAEARALERLGTDAELLAWSLAAPATAAELADEQVAVSAFRNVVPRGRAAPMDPWNRSQRRDGAGRWERGQRVGRDRVRGSKAAGRSRTAVLALTALSVSAMSLGGLGAAAYVGVLPDQVQQVMHDAVGAPAPGARGDRDHGSGSGSGNSNSSTKPAQPVTPPTAAAGSAAASRAAGLCRAWASDKAKGTARERSVAFRNLAATAGGAEKVDGYCAEVLAVKPQPGSPTGSTSSKSSGPPSNRSTGAPLHVPKTSTPKTSTPKTSIPKTSRTPNTHSPTKAGTSGRPVKGKPARTSTATTTEAPAATTGLPEHADGGGGSLDHPQPDAHQRVVVDQAELK